MARNNSPASYLWPNGLLLLLAIWLFVSPWALMAPAMGAWAWNSWAVGVVMGVLSLVALAQLAEWEDWINLVLGVWLFLSPWFFGYTDMRSAAWNSYIVGALVGIIAIWGVVAAHSHITGSTASPSR